MCTSPLGLVTLLLLLALATLAAIGPVVWGDNATAVDTAAINQRPSGGHWLGTDGLGRDVFYRVLVASRLSVELALAATAISVVVGVTLGLAPTILPRWAARLVTSAIGIAVAFPGMLLALFFAVIFGIGITGGVLAIALAGAPSFARLTQTLAASIAERDFVLAARVAGVRRIRLLLRHFLPNIGEPLVVSATIAAGNALLAFAGLSFLGIGVQAPRYDWGRLLGEGLNKIYLNPAGALGPGIAVVIAGLAFNLFGETAASVVGLRSTRKVPAPASPASRPPTAPIAKHSQAVLRVENLRVAFPTPHGWVYPVRGVSLEVAAGEIVGVVGESGSGKSLTALAVAGLLERPAAVEADRVEFCGTELLGVPPRSTASLLGTSLAMVFQDPMSSFNPTRRVGRQLAELSERHHGMSRRAAFGRAVDRLRAVRIPAAGQRARQYPHQFSGGMRQRAMIGLGLMGSPRLLIADEPTTALDVTVQRQVLELVSSVRADLGAAVLLISHDMSVIAGTCDRVLVMYAGRIVEDFQIAELHTSPRHPYTRALLAAVPDLTTDRDQPLAVIPGRPPEVGDLRTGCAFADRCPSALDRCVKEDPILVEATVGHRVACWNPSDGPLRKTATVDNGQLERADNTTGPRGDVRFETKRGGIHE